MNGAKHKHLLILELFEQTWPDQRINTITNLLKRSSMVTNKIKKANLAAVSMIKLINVADNFNLI
jgi:translation initiation factor 2B subunit (eIF-2B alpha/beta/delta family)